MNVSDNDSGVKRQRGIISKSIYNYINKKRIFNEVDIT